MAARSIVTAAVLLALGACTSSSPVGPPAGKGSAPVASANASVPEIPSAGLRAVQDYATEFCSGKAVPLHCPKGAIPAALRRPLDLPSVEAGASCPVSQPNPRIWARAAPGLGPGPVAPVGLGDQSILRFRRFAGSSWGGQKVLWVAAPSYGGPVLIRGARIDGPGGVGFNLGGDGRPLAEMQLPPGHESPDVNRGGYRAWPSYTRVRRPGCYAYQVDGTDFSYVVVFRAMPLR